MKQDNIKQSGFRALTDNEIEAVSGGFAGFGTGSAYWDAILGVSGDFSYDSQPTIAEGGGFENIPFLSFNLSDTLVATFGPDGNEDISLTLQQQIDNAIAALSVNTSGNVGLTITIPSGNGNISFTGESNGSVSVGFTGSF